MGRVVIRNSAFESEDEIEETLSEHFKIRYDIVRSEFELLFQCEVYIFILYCTSHVLYCSYILCQK